MAVSNSKVKHFVGGASVPTSGLTAGALYYAKQSDNQYVIYLAEDATTARMITTLIDSAPSGTDTGDIAKGDTIVKALSRLQGRIASLETDAASMFSIKGTLGGGGTITTIEGGVPKNGTTAVSVGRGDAYRVTTAGTYNGIECEVNDWFICSAIGSGSTQNTWVVLQGNIELSGVTAEWENDLDCIKISGAGIETYAVIPTAEISAGASSGINGLMSWNDKQKLDGIAEGANKYTLPTATASVLGGVKSSTTGTTANRDYNVQVNTDGTMKVNVPWTDTNTHVTVDSAMSSTSTNPVQNKVVNTALGGKLDKSGGTMTGTLTITESDLEVQDGEIIVGNNRIIIDGSNGSIKAGDGEDLITFKGTADYAISANSASTATSAGSAAKATQDSAGQQINTTYIKGLSVSGKTITYTKGDNSTGTITTQDTTYSVMTGASATAAGAAGLVPAPVAGKQASFLRGDGTWVVPTNTDTKVTAVGNHYTPAADSAAALSVDASSSTAATWGTTAMVTGVNLQRDAKGHVTGVTVDSIKMPSNPNTWRGIQNNLTSTSATDSLAAAQGKALNDKITTIDSALTWGSF